MPTPEIGGYGDSLRIAVIRAYIVMEIRREDNNITVCQKIFGAIKGYVSVQLATMLVQEHRRLSWIDKNEMTRFFRIRVLNGKTVIYAIHNAPTSVWVMVRLKIAAMRRYMKPAFTSETLHIYVLRFRTSNDRQEGV